MTRFTATVPTIVEDLGYSSAKAQLMTIPIYLFAVICVLIVACECQIVSLIYLLISSRLLRKGPAANAIHHAWLFSSLHRSDWHVNH